MANVKLTLVHTKTGRRYEVLSLDREARKVRLKGEQAEFEETYDPARFKQLGYTLEKEVVDA
jgi:hypothetical protein